MASKGSRKQKHRSAFQKILKALRFAFPWILDVLYLGSIVQFWLYFWPIYWQVYLLAPSEYSLIAISIACIGQVLMWLFIRCILIGPFRRVVPRLWKLYWFFILVALIAELFVRRNLSSVPESSGATLLPFCIVVVALVVASLVTIYHMLQDRTTFMRLVSFLFAQAFLVFAFAQPFIYCGFVESSWDTQSLIDEAKEVVGEERDSIVHHILISSQAQLYGISALLRNSAPTYSRASEAVPGLSLLINGSCERKNLGSALYLSTITWTSVGFGDLIPALRTRGGAAVESILGYVFMAALAAVLIRWMGQTCAKRVTGNQLDPYS